MLTTRTQRHQQLILTTITFGLLGLGLITVSLGLWSHGTGEIRSQAAELPPAEQKNTNADLLPTTEPPVPNGLHTQSVTRYVNRHGTRRLWLGSGLTSPDLVGWTPEGEVFRAPLEAKGDDRLRAVQELTNGYHYLYLLADEAQNTPVDSGYQPTGHQFYAYPQHIPGTRPVFELLQPQTGQRLLTTQTSERDQATRAGYQLVRVAFYTAN